MFRPDENAKRIQASASRILMEPPPSELFIKACKMAVNVSFEFCCSNDKEERENTNLSASVAPSSRAGV